MSTVEHLTEKKTHLPEAVRQTLLQLQEVFQQGFHLVRRSTRQPLLVAEDQPKSLLTLWEDVWANRLCSHQPAVVEEAAPFAVLAVPFAQMGHQDTVAITLLLTKPLDSGLLITSSATVGLGEAEARQWAEGKNCWSTQAACRAAEHILNSLASRQRIDQLEAENKYLSASLATTFEEISLLHAIAQNLRLSASDEDLAKLALEFMEEVVPAECLTAELLPTGSQDQSVTGRGRTKAVFFTRGECPIDHSQFEHLIAHLKLDAQSPPCVLNPPRTAKPDWPFPQIRQAIIVPISESDNLFGWFAAFNHRRNKEFGTVQASLLASVAAILGTHSGNIELYRQQAEMMAGVIRALTSAIDAKDPYTCGHSDRVARISVRLAQQLGLKEDSLDIVYLAGLLHDIGKIGINDQVLRKPGRLTDEEYAHIKQHVEIGHRILEGLRQLDSVIPAVLHHHETWDGRGYPSQLAAEQIPLVARIVAVADAYDAMSSNRPYRKGMPQEKIEQILREGAGKQWDPRVIEAFFAAKDDILKITQSKNEPQPLVNLPLKLEKK